MVDGTAGFGLIGSSLGFCCKKPKNYWKPRLRQQRIVDVGSVLALQCRRDCEKMEEDSHSIGNVHGAITLGVTRWNFAAETGAERHARGVRERDALPPWVRFLVRIRV